MPCGDPKVRKNPITSGVERFNIKLNISPKAGESFSPFICWLKRADDSQGPRAIRLVNFMTETSPYFCLIRIARPNSAKLSPSLKDAQLKPGLDFVLLFMTTGKTHLIYNFYLPTVPGPVGGRDRKMTLKVPYYTQSLLFFFPASSGAALHDYPSKKTPRKSIFT